MIHDSPHLPSKLLAEFAIEAVIRVPRRMNSPDFVWESLLPQRLEQNQRDAIGQIQRTRFRLEHRNPQPAFAVVGQELLRQPGRLAPEHQIIVRRKFRVIVKFRPLRFDEPQPRWRRNIPREGRPVFPAMPFDLPPVIHAGALQLRIVQLETERLNEVQDRLRSRA